MSLTVGNPVASVLAHAMGGEPEAALAVFDRSLTSVARPDVVLDLCAAAGLTTTLVQGIGLFTDLVPGAAQELAEAEAAVAELDRVAARLAPYRDLARRVHIVARTQPAESH